MTGYVTVIGGVNGTVPSGIVSVPSTLSQASVTQSGSFLNTVQNFLGGVSDSVLAGTYNLYNLDTVAGLTNSVVAGTPSGGIYEITNTDSLGNITAGSVSVDAHVSGTYTTIVLEAPGSTTLTGNGASVASTYVLGSETNAVVSTMGSGEGTNTIYGLGGNDTIYAAGSNNATFVGGVDRYKVVSGGTSSVVAAGNATMQAGVQSGDSGFLNFINDSSAQATVFGEAGQVTAYGGNAGGLFYAGTGGANSLVGGAGSATLVGAVSGDTLEAGFALDGTTSVASASNNYLFAGSGNETLLASAGTQNTQVDLGLGNDYVSTAGSGNQYFFSANSVGGGSSTIWGTEASTGGNNLYFLGTTLSASGATDYIWNYSSVNSHLYAVNGDVITSISASVGGTAGTTGALVQLSDGTNVLLVGVTASDLSVSHHGTQLNYT